MFTARVGKAHRKALERKGGIIHDGARSGTRERGSEYGEAARSCTSGRGTGDAGPAGMMRGYAPPPAFAPGAERRDELLKSADGFGRRTKTHEVAKGRSNSG